MKSPYISPRFSVILAILCLDMLPADVVIRSVRQKHYFQCAAMTGSAASDVKRFEGAAGVPHARSWTARAHAGTGVLETSAEATLTTEVSQLANGFRNSSTISASQSGVYPSVTCHQLLEIECEVIGSTSEIVTGILSSLVRTGDALASSPVSYYFTYRMPGETSWPSLGPPLSFPANGSLPATFAKEIGGLGPGVIYRIQTWHEVFWNDYNDHSGSESRTVDLTFTNMVINPGAIQTSPLLPGPGGNFSGVPGGLWYDPPMAQGYSFTSTGTGQFKQILAFPSGIAGNYFVTTEGQTYGPFDPKDSVDFVTLRGHGVSQFVLKGIKPFVDSANPAAFPIMLDFTTPTLDFTMVPIPAPDLQMVTLPNGDLQITYEGVLQFSGDLTAWSDITPAPDNPYVIPKSQVSGTKFFRAREPVTSNP